MHVNSRVDDLDIGTNSDFSESLEILPLMCIRLKRCHNTSYYMIITSS